jgi:hypothetical protein
VDPLLYVIVDPQTTEVYNAPAVKGWLLLKYVGDCVPVPDIVLLYTKPIKPSLPTIP